MITIATLILILMWAPAAICPIAYVAVRLMHGGSLTDQQIRDIEAGRLGEAVHEPAWTPPYED